MQDPFLLKKLNKVVLDNIAERMFDFGLTFCVAEGILHIRGKPNE